MELKEKVLTKEQSATLRKNYRNVWCILRTIDQQDVSFSDPALEDEWKICWWTAFRESPHRFFIRCDTRVADAIWAVVEKRLSGLGVPRRKA